ncbi:Predicted unusual protein kinase regulating ubiquinone biosynthesis, AarF/ABC1/UbiB family [Raineyella antarctica]|uniref:Predicted unusual protein kinase regulating ubiquinone biosynthesis, AarF/ABC1/UbiB family n=1 Tax=Raineyella antarctica TaxID=1577474 RepID=A0A1G6IF90_9ACTN|nr:AarF/UbiB family protein [Raineyella antarctica]SDC05189.1 Predicted unusual protein kinase regulating ubiquinone biosynthesis, AarF/ABC1/UbiB family [Raineyella antarctica]
MKESVLRARYRRIVWFFARVTASFIWWEVVLRRLGFGRLADRTRSRRNVRTAARFRALAISMGGLMIKVGQFMSARLDVLPPEITEELADLQDQVPPEEFAAIREVALAELDLPLTDHFAWFDEEPLAAASLGQVHRARLKDADAAELGYGDVVVKVQRPHIQRVIEVDLSALRRVGQWLTHYRPVASRADVPALVEEFATTTLAEVDYLAEAGNAETFTANFADDPRVSVPRVVWEQTTRRVLTLEDVSAIRIGDHDAITAAGIDRGEVANVLADTYLQQIFVDAFFHADPHPGNLFVTPHPGSGPGEPDWTLTFIDFGMVGRVPDTLREGLTEALIAVGTRDGARLVHSMQTLDVLLPGADLPLIERATMQVFDRFGGMSMDQLRNVDHAEMMRFGLQFRELMQEMPFQLPEHLLMLGRSIGLLSGMCTGLDPDFNIWGTITPYAKELVAGEGGSTTETIVAEAGKLAMLALSLPGRADRVLTQVERGELNLQTPQLTRQVRRLQRTVSRTNGILVFAALLIAGALVTGTEPMLGRWLMGASVVPLLWAMVAGRGGPHGR